MSSPDAHDVVIVGCGPVGALAACLLGRAGLSVLVLERDLTHYPLPRAVHLDHEMVRLFQSAGVIDQVLPDMVDTDGHLHIGADAQVIRYMGTVGHTRPFGWSNDWFFYQPELETHLRAGFAGMPNVTLKTGAEFVGLTQPAPLPFRGGAGGGGSPHSPIPVERRNPSTLASGDSPLPNPSPEGEGLTVTYTQDGADHQVTARWAIACDGSRSPVRKALGVALDDLGFEEPWLVVDAEVDGPVAFPAITGVPQAADLQRLSVMVCDPTRPATVVPGRGNHRRWEMMLLPGEDDAAISAPESVIALLDPWIGHVPHTIVRSATYHFHGLVAEQWQVGNVFLAGDAAHQTPPFFGQGMCHGLRDVANLAWKMAAIVNDHADPAILTTYQPERDPHVRAVIGAAVATGRYICELDPAKAAIRDAEMVARAAAQAGTPQTAADLIQPIATGVILAGSTGAGERFIQPELADGRKLDDMTGQGWRLFIDGPAPGANGITVVNIATIDDGGALRQWLAARDALAVLVRPDHYVFGTGTPATLIAAQASALGHVAETVA